MEVGACVSDTVFREMFVELPRAVLEALQGIGEQAVRKAQAYKAPEQTRSRTPTLADLFTHVAGILRERYGWRRAVCVRLADRCSYEITALLSCGHLHRIEIEEELFLHARGGADAADALFDRLDRVRRQRSCTCIPRAA